MAHLVEPQRDGHFGDRFHAKAFADLVVVVDRMHLDYLPRCLMSWRLEGHEGTGQALCSATPWNAAMLQIRFVGGVTRRVITTGTWGARGCFVVPIHAHNHILHEKQVA